MDDAPKLEEMLIESGVKIIKLYYSVSKSEQAARFEDRKLNPLKQFKLSPIDQFSQQLWKKYTLAEYHNFKNTSTKKSPWTIVNSDDKKASRINSIKYVLGLFDYPEKISKKEVAMLKDVFRSEIKPSLSKLQPPLLSRIKKNASGLLSAKKKPSVKQLESQADLTEERLGSSYSRMMYDAFSSSSAVPGMGVSTEYATILMDLENENQMAFYQERPHQHPKREMDSKAVEDKSQVDFDVASLGSVESDVRDDVSIDSENSEESDASQSASFRMGFNK